MKTYVNSDVFVLLVIALSFIWMANQLGADTKNSYFAGIELIEKVYSVCREFELKPVNPLARLKGGQ